MLLLFLWWPWQHWSILLMISELTWSKSDEYTFHPDSDFTDPFDFQFCTWHIVTVVVSCARLWINENNITNECKVHFNQIYMSKTWNMLVMLPRSLCHNIKNPNNKYVYCQSQEQFKINPHVLKLTAGHFRWVVGCPVLPQLPQWNCIFCPST